MENFASRHTWKVLAAIGLGFVYWGIHMAFVIPTFPPAQWDWLTTDPEVVEYIKFRFQNQGAWTLANGIMYTLIAAAAFRKRERWAWRTLWLLPLHIVLLTSHFFWLSMFTLPLAALAAWLLLASRPSFPRPGEGSGHPGWVLLAVVGLAILYFAYDNFFVIPALDPRDPARGWDWLTSDPEVIDYIKFYFRVYGLRVLAFGLLILSTAAVGLRGGSRLAWWPLCTVPLLALAHLFLWPWLAALLIGVALVSAFGLLWSFPRKHAPLPP